MKSPVRVLLNTYRSKLKILCNEVAISPSGSPFGFALRVRPSGSPVPYGGKPACRAGLTSPLR
ncbi:hypothetical protein AB0759_33355, partial [Scytonema tolypothrichoides VB-61278_2]